MKSYGSFPPQVQKQQASVAGFLHLKGSGSKRPLSLIKMAWAAITHYYDAIGIDIRSGELTHFMQALVKNGTSCPQGRTPVPPIQPILDVFRKWGNNEELSLQRLRQKCITLLCLTAMCRPSDIAPKIGFLRKQIEFNSDNSVTIRFFGIKNDQHRKGFEIKLTPANETCVDPVACLKCYIQRSSQYDIDSRHDLDTPVFRSLTHPMEAISPTTVANILNDTLREAGLAQKFSARSFRAAGVTAAIDSGCDPDSTRQIGRWASREVFFDHYVYPGAVGITNKILSHK